jgi:hypothetical protein
MRHNQNRRSRNRNRKGPNPLTRSFESNGPDVKVRGTAAHVAEKYMSLARDAQSSGDIVAAENYLQHAEHYNRIVMAAQAQFQQERQAQFGDQPEGDDRQFNGRGPNDYNNDGPRDDDGEGPSPDDRFASTEEEQERGFQQRQQRDDRNQQRGPRYNNRYDRRDRYERDDRQDRYARGDRQDRYERSEEQEPRVEARDAPPPPPVEQVAQEEPKAPPRRKRGRPRADNGGEAEGDSTPDGAAALAAFPD